MEHPSREDCGSGLTERKSETFQRLVTDNLNKDNNVMQPGGTSSVGALEKGRVDKHHNVSRLLARATIRTSQVYR